MTDKADRKTQYIPINKGNYTMESDERMARFSALMGKGWEKEYREYRENWSEYPKRLFVSPYPLLVDLELSTICNLKCPMCYTITDDFKRKVKTGFMSFDLFTKVVDEIAGKVPALRLSLRGEPTIHPQFIEAVKYAKKKGIREVSTLTNGSTLNAGFFHNMAEAGIDWITISVDGLGPTYEQIRKPLKFADTLGKIRDIKAWKDSNGAHKPVIKIQAIWPSIRENPEEFYNTFAPYVDQVAFNPLIDYLGNDDDLVYEPDFSCPQLYQRLVIGADGRVMMCSNDEESTVIIGDASTESVHDLWHGEPLNAMRETHRRPKGFSTVPVCRKCYLPRMTEESETARVNGREFIIQNYVNRPQLIGT